MIRQFCQEHDVAALSLFGSAIREDFGVTSDIDLLVEFAPHAEPSLRELSTMQNELERLLGRPVDLVERKAIEQSRNYILRKHILGHLEPIYVA
ncbi:MAG: nucleotidyltransferase domain-containing protein [Accumulibacter sp.]|uniref:nucleotidyltransferase family protein n=1 Tax=Accumulibacter sp. TaxID=2053492 RepID=UPI002FC3B181